MLEFAAAFAGPRRARILTPPMEALHSADREISVIVPVLDEAERIGGTLANIRALGECEVVVVDGGSRDGTPEAAASLADRVMRAPVGRARQMNAGADAAGGRMLWFLHADTRPPPDALSRIREAVASGGSWGRFDLRLDGRHPAFRVIERFINWRSALSGIATGDQGIFVTRAAFDAVGKYPDMPLMEDVALSRALKELQRPFRIREPVMSSSRRWESRGIVRTTLLMWRLRFAFWRGADPAVLARRYLARTAGEER